MFSTSRTTSESYLIFAAGHQGAHGPGDRLLPQNGTRQLFPRGAVFRSIVNLEVILRDFLVQEQQALAARHVDILPGRAKVRDV
jgi:hypothetical protein